MYAWNNHYHVSTTIDLATNKVTWTETKPRNTVTVKITAAQNGFIFWSSDLRYSGDICEIYPSIWDCKRRLEECLVEEIPHEEDFVPSHYDQATLDKLGLDTQEPL